MRNIAKRLISGKGIGYQRSLLVEQNAQTIRTIKDHIPNIYLRDR